jgi:hypothetical protein
MNKFLTALIVGAITASAFAQSTLVYDFKASVKRINPVISTIKYSSDVWDAKKNDVSTKLASYAVVNDTLKGYFAVTACSTCAAEGWEEFNADENAADLYITRTGDKKKLAWSFENVSVNGGVFGKGVGTRFDDDALADGPTSLKNIKSAWMYIGFGTDVYGYNTTNKAYGTDVFPFYGLLGEDYQGVEIECAGFGKAVGGSTTTVIEGGICAPGSTSTAGCIRIDSITGTITGMADIEGPCDTPMWDSCVTTIVPDEDDEDAEYEAGTLNEVAVCGTWSIKFNKKMTQKVNNGLADEDAFILSSLKAKSAIQDGFTDLDGEAWAEDIITADGDAEDGEEDGE